MEQQGTIYNSKAFPGHYYQVLRELGRGGMGTVYLVLLREQITDNRVKLFAAKVVYESYLRQENEEARRLNLQ